MIRAGRKVYFIRPVGMRGPIKIGCSFSPDNRRRTLETWSPFALEVLAEIDGDTKLERRFHARFADFHRHHEWFDWSPDLQSVVEAVASGTFKVDDLPAPQRVTHRSGRDNSYSTPGWRYDRSIQARCWKLRERGLSWTEIDQSGVREFDLRHAGQARVDEVKAVVEPIMAAFTARFPTKRRSPVKATAA